MNKPAGMPEPEPKRNWLATLGGALLIFVAIATVLTVLVFGTCLLLLRH